MEHPSLVLGSPPVSTANQTTKLAPGLYTGVGYLSAGGVTSSPAWGNQCWKAPSQANMMPSLDRPWDTHHSDTRTLEKESHSSYGLGLLPTRGQQSVPTYSTSSGVAASPIAPSTIVVPVMEAQTSLRNLSARSSMVFSQPKAGSTSASQSYTPQATIIWPVGWRDMNSSFSDNDTTSWSDDSHLDADISSTGSSARDWPSYSSHPDADISSWEYSYNCSHVNADTSPRDLCGEQLSIGPLDADDSSVADDLTPMSPSPTLLNNTDDTSNISFNAIFCSSPARSGGYLPDLEESLIEPSPQLSWELPYSANLSIMGTTSCAPFTEAAEGLDQTLASDPAEADEGLTLLQNAGRRMIDVILHEDYEYRRACSSVRGRHDQKWVCRYASRFKCKGTLRIIVQDLEDFMNGASIRHKREHNHDPFSFDADDSDKYNLENYSTDDLSTIFERMVATKRIVGNKSRRL